MGTEPTARAYFETELAKHLGKAREITDLADREARAMTDNEKETVNGHLEKAEEYKLRIKDLADNEELRANIDKLAAIQVVPDGRVDSPSSRPAKSIGDLVVRSPQFKALREQMKNGGGLNGRWSTGPIEVPSSLWFGGKAAITDGQGLAVVAEGDDSAGNMTSGPGGDLPQPQVLPGIQAPGFQRLTIADLLAPGTTTTNTVRYLRETSATNAAASVHEGALKPVSAFDFEAVNEPVVKIATFLPVSEEMLEDVAQIRSYLDERLRQFVQIEEEDQLLNATGSGDDLDGLLNRVTQAIDAANYDNLFDAIAAARVKCQTVGFAEPDAIVINPNDSFDLDTMKAVAGTGGYFSGGPYSQAADTPWGMRMVRTTAIAAGHVLVGAFRTQAQIFRRGGLTVEASNSHEDYFRRNLVAIRAEERLALAVYRVNAFTEITNAS